MLKDPMCPVLNQYNVVQNWIFGVVERIVRNWLVWTKRDAKMKV